MGQLVYTSRSLRIGKLLVILRSLELREVKDIVLDDRKLCFMKKYPYGLAERCISLSHIIQLPKTGYEITVQALNQNKSIIF
jgi:hypothetical protein